MPTVRDKKHDQTKCVIDQDYKDYTVVLLVLITYIYPICQNFHLFPFLQIK